MRNGRLLSAKAIILVFIGCLLFCAAAFFAKAQDAATITANEIHDCMIYEDYVVEGVVVSFKWEEIPIKDLFPNISNSFMLNKRQKFRVFEFEVTNELIGNLKGEKITLHGLPTSVNWIYDIKEGDKYIIPLIYNSYKGGVYGIRGGDVCRFLIEGDTFIRGLKDKPIQRGKVSDLYRAIEEIKEMRSLGTIIDEAELIVRGTVKDRWATDDTLSFGMSKDIERIKLSVEECLKGDFTGDEIEFSVIYWATVPCQLK